MELFQTMPFLRLVVLILIYTTAACLGALSLNDHNKAVKEAEDAELSKSFGYAIDPKDNVYGTKALEKVEQSIPGWDKNKISKAEMQANDNLMVLKQLQYEQGMKDPSKFHGSKHTFEILDIINETRLFKAVRKMPKFGNLHCHQTAMGTVEFMLSMATSKFYDGKYYDRIYLLHGKEEKDIRGFKISNNAPKVDAKKFPGCTYTLLKNLKMGEKNLLKYLRPLVTMKNNDNTHPTLKYPFSNLAWDKFTNIFDVIGGLLNFEPFLRKHIEHGLTQHLDDGSQYVEIKATFGMTYSLEKPALSKNDSFIVYKEVCAKFAKDHAGDGWIGAKAIFSPFKGVPIKKVHDSYFQTYKELKALDGIDCFLAGFDLTGPEEFTATLEHHLPKIKEMDADTNFFFHAGETNYYGTNYDGNLNHAIHLDSKRIGHGTALPKHPNLMEKVKKRKICIESCPISNNVLKLVNDFRTHPLAYMLANNVELVLSSEVASFWECYPLTHDFYIAFQYVSSYMHDTRILKRFAINSIKYSALNTKDQAKALKSYMEKYLKWCDEMAKLDVSKEKTELDALRSARLKYFVA